jgi:hypothetical protein
MSENVTRLKRDLQIIQGALGLDIWTSGDVRRGFLGALAGGAVSLLLAVWMFCGGDLVAGMLGYLILLQAIHILKAVGFRKNAAPSAGTQREVAFFNRYYTIGALLIGCFYFWGRVQGIETQVLFASAVVVAGMWYAFYAISSPSRGLSMAGAVALMIGGFVLPEAHNASQMFCWLGISACLGCWSEAALLVLALRQKTSNSGPPENPLPGASFQIPCPPPAPAPVHAAD